MDKLLLKSLGLVIGVCLMTTFSIAQEVRRLPVNSRRPLPTVIITREHLRQRQNNYGTYGDTAAEFVVSAGLDTSKNSAVRIRRIGHRRDNNTNGSRPNINQFNLLNSTGGFGRNSIRLDQRQRNPGFINANERNGIPGTVTYSNRRHNLNEGEFNRRPIDRRNQLQSDQQLRSPNGQNIQNFNINTAVNLERQHYNYRPPIFVPNYQQSRRSDVAVGVPGETKKRPPNEIVNDHQKRPNFNINEQRYPIVSVKYSTSSVTYDTSRKQHPRPEFNTNGNAEHIKKQMQTRNGNNKEPNYGQHVRGNSKYPFLARNITQSESNYKPSNLNNTGQLYTTLVNSSVFVPKQYSQNTEISHKNISNSSSKLPIFTNETDSEEKRTPGNLNKKIDAHTSDVNEEYSKIANRNKMAEVVSRSPVVEVANPEKNVLAETSPLQLHSVKLHEFQTRLIRKPSLILRDQITVNELPNKLDRPRFGPRSLEHSEEIQPTSRRKRNAGIFFDVDNYQVNNLTNDEFISEQFVEENKDSMLDNFDVGEAKAQKTKSLGHLNHSSEMFNDKITYHLFPSNGTKSTFDSEKNKRQGRFNYENFHVQDAQKVNSRDKLYFPEKNEKSLYNDTLFNSSLEVNKSHMYKQHHLEDQFSDDTYYQESEQSPDGDIMSFSDFLASPLVDQLRLERQLIFRDLNFSSSNVSHKNTPINSTYDSRSLKNNTMLHLRKLIATRLLNTVLNMSNTSNNYSYELKPGKNAEGLTAAEQRHYGIMVSPYEDHENLDSKTSKPVVRILKGRLVSLPDLPPELIPIILGTYKPTYTNENEDLQYDDDRKLPENILDNAIYTLLKNEDMFHVQPVMQKTPNMGYKVNRKSPSTNYVGSLKSSDPPGRPTYTYKPVGAWSTGPRCDRLTEEICLDDSDYPSSAIMSSIYKDKTRFDLMYAEVKVRESQVEGLSRQQEASYSFDHYFGYPQSSSTNLVAKDYGPKGGFVCPSEVYYARPHRAKNRKGEWKVVVNVGEYTQTLRMEKCLSSGNPCKYVVSHMQSTCSQVYSYHRLLVFNKDSGLHIDVFRVPTACTCHLRSGQNMYNPKVSASAPYLVRPNPYEEIKTRVPYEEINSRYPYDDMKTRYNYEDLKHRQPYEEFGGHVENANAPQTLTEYPNQKLDKKKNSFSNTLWAILGGGQQASTLAQQPQFLDEVQKQITWTQQLKKFPQLMKQISPDQVLKQLLEDEEEDYGIRRHRIRQKSQIDQLVSGSFASHQIPIAVPLPPPPPPPNGVHRRPVVSIAPMDQTHFYPTMPNVPPKVTEITSPLPTQVFSLTKDNKSHGRPSLDPGYRNVYNIIGPHHFAPGNVYKVFPGMYPPKSENVQVPESTLHPVSTQFSSHSDGHLNLVMKPFPIPQGSTKNIAEHEDLLAVEKSADDADDANNDYAGESEADKDSATEDNDSKINFSYHPILEYLNM